MNLIYHNKHINVYQVGNEYIVHNTKKKWKIDGDDEDCKGHTHIEHRKTAIWICDIAAYKRLPRTNCDYFYRSLIRLSDDPSYTKKIK